jgi:hypothetical protein
MSVSGVFTVGVQDEGEGVKYNLVGGGGGLYARGLRNLSHQCSTNKSRPAV